MSNSEPSRLAADKRFACAFAAVVVAAIGPLLGLAATMDPTGLVGHETGWSSGWCTAGISLDSREAKPLLARFYRPREILLGSSRVDSGFAERDADELLAAPVLNLAVNGASIEDMASLFDEAAAAGALQRAWIGLDFGMFTSDDIPPPLPLPGNYPEPLVLLRHALADPGVIRHALRKASDAQSCRKPAYSVRGFLNLAPVLAAPTGRAPAEYLAMEAADREWRIMRMAAQNPRSRESSYRSRVRRLEALIDRAAASNVDLVLFLNPSHVRFHRLIDQARLDSFRRRWRADMATLAARRGLVLIDLTDQADFDSPVAGCRVSDCHFFDLTHYRPHVGRFILERGIATGASRPATPVQR